jgi:hypothetical protein
MKLTRFRKPKAASSPSYVEYRPNTSISNIMENRFTLRGGHQFEREDKRMKLRK